MWPTHFPRDCPPQSARDVSGDKVYRLLMSTEPHADDFRSYYELGKHTNQASCQNRGLSVQSSFGGAERLFRKAKGFKAIAQGHLPVGMGKILDTASDYAGSDHQTWWVPREPKRKPQNLFTTVRVRSDATGEVDQDGSA